MVITHHTGHPFAIQISDQVDDANLSAITDWLDSYDENGSSYMLFYGNQEILILFTDDDLAALFKMSWL